MIIYWYKLSLSSHFRDRPSINAVLRKPILQNRIRKFLTDSVSFRQTFVVWVELREVLLVLKPQYSEIIWSITLLLMAWCLVSPGQQQPWYCLYRINGFKPADTIDSRYIAVMYDTIVQTVQQLQWMNFSQICTHEMSPQISPLRASYGVFFVNSTKKNDRNISRAHCTLAPCFNNYPQVGFIDQNLFLFDEFQKLMLFLSWCEGIIYWKIMKLAPQWIELFIAGVSWGV